MVLCAYRADDSRAVVPVVEAGALPYHSSPEGQWLEEAGPRCGPSRGG
jgi:hypothetical protein